MNAGMLDEQEVSMLAGEVNMQLEELRLEPLSGADVAGRGQAAILDTRAT